MSNKKLAPAHPAEVLLEESLQPMGLGQSRLALSIGVHPRRVNEIVLRKRGVTADTALRSAKFWVGLQMDYDLDIASHALGSRVDHEVRPPTSAA